MANDRRRLWGSRGLDPLPFVGEGRRGRRESKERQPMSSLEFRNSLLGIMSEKTHWAASAFAGMVPKEKTGYHFEAEARAFVEPFTRYLSGAMSQCPIPEVRSALAENILEKETGVGARKIIIEQGLTDTVPTDTSHFALFLLIPEAMGHDTTHYAKRPLGPKTEAYRNFLMNATQKRGWEVAVAVSTLFLEGNQHPVHRGYGVPVENLLLPAVHHVFDSAGGDHRRAAWDMLLNHIAPEKRKEVLAAMHDARKHWHAWRDEVAEKCGIVKDREGYPVLAN